MNVTTNPTDKIAALFLVRNEDWCIGASLRAALQYAEHAVICPDRCTDRTLEIIDQVALEHPGRLTKVQSPEPDSRHWPEMTARQRTLEAARGLGCKYFAINDADEVVSAKVIREMQNPATRQAFLNHIREPGNAAGLSMMSPYNGSWQTLRTDRHYASSCVTWLVHDRPDLCWANADDGYCHHQRLPRGARHTLTWPRSAGGIFHLQFVNRKRLVAKAVWYKLQETVSWPNRMNAGALNAKYDWAITEENIQTQPTPEADLADPISWCAQHADFAAEPWQLAEAKRLIAEHGRSRFADIQLYEHILGPLS